MLRPRGRLNFGAPSNVPSDGPGVMLHLDFQFITTWGRVLLSSSSDHLRDNTEGRNKGLRGAFQPQVAFVTTKIDSRITKSQYAGFSFMPKPHPQLAH